MKALWAPWRLSYIKGDDKAPGSCVFCPAGYDSPYCLYTSDHAAIFLNRFPYANGHAMVVPRRHVADLQDLTDPEILAIEQLSTLCLRVLRQWMKAEGFNVGYNLGEVAGAGIAAHLHRHIVSRWRGDVNYMTVLADVKVIPEHIEQTAREFKRRIEALL